MKRIFDFLVSAFLLVILSPLLVTISLLILICMGCPILFRQHRPGKNGKIFSVKKFRTMSIEPGSGNEVTVDRARVTSLGKFLRKTSLDELPQLWNVLLGEMSLIGPRPLLVEYLPLYSKEQMRRHEVRPGITGWAQINGRNSISWEEKFELDLWYVENRSLLLDLKILYMTAENVIRRQNVDAGSDITMPKFTGS